MVRCSLPPPQISSSFQPSLLSLAPGESHNICVCPTTPLAATEETYRVFVAEMPPLETPEGDPTAGRILTRMGIPIFLQPAKVLQ